MFRLAHKGKVTARSPEGKADRSAIQADGAEGRGSEAFQDGAADG